jgi:hypothetical protein
VGGTLYCDLHTTATSEADKSIASKPVHFARIAGWSNMASTNIPQKMTLDKG